MTQEQPKWELKSHTWAIADTGDYDGCAELTTGDISLFTDHDEDDDLYPVIEALNKAGSRWWISDTDKVDAYLYKQERDELSEEVAALRREVEELRQQVGDMLFVVRELATDDAYLVYDAVDPDFKNLRDIAKLTYKGLSKP